jgi:diguanylate cyclase (GGDEF)-like protein
MTNLRQQASLVRKFFERRNPQLFEGIRHERAAIAERMSAQGILHSGAFVSAVTKAHVAGFENFARGLIKDTFDVLNRSGVVIDSDAASWLKAQLDPFLEAAAKNIRSEASQGRVLTDELTQSVDRAIDKSLAEIRRDLQIELDLALVTRAPAPDVIEEAFRDSLVPLQNRRGFEAEFGVRTKGASEPVCLVLFDIDYFKEVNDKYGGHATGDEALLSIAEVAAACVRGKGKAFRFGGDEFVLMLPNHTLEEGLAVAERFRAAVNSAARTSHQLTLSVSVGVAVWPSDGAELDALLKAADRALYDAKSLGRNVVRGASEAAVRRVAPKPAPGIKWVDLEYPERSGLQTRLNAQGFKLTWRRDDKPRDDDAEPVTIDDAGQPVMLKVNSPDSALTLYQIRQ